MRLRVLGCSGGIGGRHLRTTSFLVDGDILIDAGTGVGDLTLAELSQIDHIFVTHSHLDHVASIPFLVDTVGGMRSKPLTTLGKPGVQVAVLTRRPQGYFITHVEGAARPNVNGQQIGPAPHALKDHDVIELAGVKMEFFLKA